MYLHFWYKIQIILDKNISALFTKLLNERCTIHLTKMLHWSIGRKNFTNWSIKEHSKYFQREVDRTQYFIAFWHLRFSMFQTRCWLHSLTLKPRSYASVIEENAAIMCRRRPWERERLILFISYKDSLGAILLLAFVVVKARRFVTSVGTQEWWITFETFWHLSDSDRKNFSRFLEIRIIIMY